MLVRLVILSVLEAPLSLAVTRSTPAGMVSVLKFQSVAWLRPAKVLPALSVSAVLSTST